MKKENIKLSSGEKALQETDLMISLKQAELGTLRRYRLVALSGGVLQVSALAFLMAGDYDPIFPAGTVYQGLSIGSVCAYHALKKQKREIKMSSKEISTSKKIHIHYINAAAFLAPICSLFALQNGSGLFASGFILISSKALCWHFDAFFDWNRDIKRTKADLQSLQELRKDEEAVLAYQKEYGKYKKQ